MRLLILLARSLPVLGQEFEAVSVKPNASPSTGVSSSSDPGMWTETNMDLRRLIVMAYAVRQIDGPDWLGSARFDITAKYPQVFPKPRQGPNPALRVMLQKMLADRFRLEVHRETRVLPVQALTIAKHGPKFRAVPEDCQHDQSGGANHYVGKCVTIASIVALLDRNSDLPVIDRTGLKGTYNVKLDWVPDAKTADAPQGPTLAEALEEQLGLKLENRKAPVEVLVVDHVERNPSGN